MKKSEKQMILILIIVAIIIIAVLVKVRNGKETETEINTGNTGTNIQTSNVNNNGTNNTNDTNSKEEYVQILEDGTKLNVSEKLAETKKVGNYEISNIQITQKGDDCIFIANAKNTSGSKMEEKFGTVVFLDKEGNQMTTADIIIGKTEVGEAVQIKASLTTDFSNTYDFTMTINE